MTTVFKILNSYKQFVRHAFFGGIGVLTNIMIYSLLVYFQFNYQVAYATELNFKAKISSKRLGEPAILVVDNSRILSKIN